MRKSWICFAGLLALSLGVLLLAATGFLTYWQNASQGQHDIAARGGILLFVLLPWLLGITSIAVLGLSVVLQRPVGQERWRIAGLTLSAFTAAALLEFLPPFVVPSTLALVPSSLRPVVDFAVATLLVVAGSMVVRQASLPVPPNGRCS